MPTDVTTLSDEELQQLLVELRTEQERRQRRAATLDALEQYAATGGDVRALVDEVQPPESVPAD